MVSLDDRLRSVPFFRSLPADDLAAIAVRLKLRTVRKGAMVFREGDAADAMYFVDSGQLEVVRGPGSRPIAVLGSGSVAGELALLLGEPRSATLRAASSCRLWSLARDDLDQLLSAHPAIALELSAELGRRLVTTTRRLTQGDVTRVTVAFGGVADALSAAIAAQGQKVGVIALRTVALADLAKMAVERYRELDVVVVKAGRAASPVARAAVDTAEWVVSDARLPAWVLARQSAERILEVDDPASVTVAARRVSGQAVALALSSGGSKTMAHIGVIAGLRERGIDFDAVAGSSGGALVAAGIAAHVSTDEITGYIRLLAAQLRPRRWDIHLVPRTGIIKGRRLRDLFDRWFDGRSFSDLPTPLYIVASDMLTGEEVVFDSGSLADALRASMSIPGAFDPWRHQGRLLLDGGVTDPLPAGPLRQAGFERVVASNVAGKDVDPTASPGARLPSILNVMLRTVNLMEAEVVKAQLALADVVIRPNVQASGSFDFTQIDGFIAEGREAVARQDDELRRLGFTRS